MMPFLSQYLCHCPETIHRLVLLCCFLVLFTYLVPRVSLLETRLLFYLLPRLAQMCESIQAGIPQSPSLYPSDLLAS